jgi:hypothetical protein
MALFEVAPGARVWGRRSSVVRGRLMMFKEMGDALNRLVSSVVTRGRKKQRSAPSISLFPHAAHNGGENPWMIGQRLIASIGYLNMAVEVVKH